MIERIKSYRSFCIICGAWETLHFRDPTLGTHGLCNACANSVVRADKLLFSSGFTQPTRDLIYSLKHKLL